MFRDLPEFLACIGLLLALAFGTSTCVMPLLEAEASQIILSPVGDWNPSSAKQIVPERPNMRPPDGIDTIVLDAKLRVKPPYGYFQIRQVPEKAYPEELADILLELNHCSLPLPRCDPCRQVKNLDECATAEGAVRVWVEQAFGEEADLAFLVVKAETAGTFLPEQRTYGDCCASGLFQITSGTWNYIIKNGPVYMRTWDRARWWSEPGDDRLNGWHNTLAAKWLRDDDGWSRWNVCESAKRPEEAKVSC